MEKLQLRSLGLALVTVLAVGGGTVFASQNQNPNKSVTPIEAKATTQTVASTEATPATKLTPLTAEQIAAMVKGGTSASTKATTTQTVTSTEATNVTNK